MFKWGIRARLALSFLVLVIAAMTLLGSYILWYFYQHNIDILTANLLTNAKITEQLLEENMISLHEKAKLDTKIKEASIKTDLRVTVVDTTGLVIADSWENPAIMENHLERSEVAAALTGETGHTVRYSDTIGQNMLYVAVPARSGTEITGVVRVATPLTQVEYGFNKIRSALFAAMLITSLLSVLLGAKLAEKYTSPLESVIAAAREIAEGKLERRVHIHTGDELELLAHTLNNLTSSLEDKITQLVAETNKLSLILKNMDNAVFLLDLYGRVTTANEPARTVFEITEEMIGKHNLHVIGNSMFDRTVHQAISQNKSQTIDVKTNIRDQKRVFQVFLAPVRAAENNITGVLAVFHDITTLQEIHERQAEFVSNASHELATPLTAIKGFAETLLDGALDDAGLRRKFVNIIYTEADRMHRLIKDLLQLAKLDSEEYRRQLRIEGISVKPLLEKVVQELSHPANRKKITLSVDPDCQPIAAMADYDWLKQVLFNLVDNGIKYTPDEGQVSLKCWADNQYAYVAVKDTGIGIPPKDLPLIFDRFYRVDKARSRSAGGTGLGLAIVKFVIEMHGGSINVKSRMNAGTTFTFSLPLAQAPGAEQ